MPITHLSEAWKLLEQHAEHLGVGCLWQVLHEQDLVGHCGAGHRASGYGGLGSRGGGGSSAVAGPALAPHELVCKAMNE